MLSLIAIMVLAPCTMAKNIDNLYVVKNTSMDKYIPSLTKVLKQPTVKQDVLYSTDNNYFIHLYQSGNDINLFLNCDKQSQEEYQKLLKSLDFKTYSFEDKDLKKQYTSDFKKYVALNDISLNGVKVDKNAYNPYNKPLKNRIISTTKYSEQGIDFVTNKVQMKSKIKKYVEGFEIVVTNNTDSNIVLKKAATGDFVGLTEIAKKAAIPSGVDFVPIYGIIAGAKTDLEKNRFTRPFPTDYTIKKGDSVRLLGISRLQVYPIVDFTFEINGKEKIIQLQTYQ
jgi:hypothetical protein